MVNEGYPGRTHPERGEEGDPVDNLERHVRVRHEPAQLAPYRAREDGGAPSHAVDLEAIGNALVARRTLVSAGHDGHPVPPRDPARDLPEEVRAGASRLGMGP